MPAKGNQKQRAARAGSNSGNGKASAKGTPKGGGREAARAPASAPAKAKSGARSRVNADRATPIETGVRSGAGRSVTGGKQGKAESLRADRLRARADASPMDSSDAIGGREKNRRGGARLGRGGRAVERTA